MDNHRIFIKISFLLVLLLVLNVKRSNGDHLPYEPAENACERCNCTNDNSSLTETDGNVIKNVFQLDCSMKNFKHLLAGWPEHLGEDHQKTELIYILSFNDINVLQQLPSTDAYVVFTCRHCKITTIESEAFIDTPNIVKLDLSWNKINADELRPDIFRGKYSDSEYETIKLETLDLSHNDIQMLDKMIFEHVPDIRMLDLSYNSLHVIDEGTAIAIGFLHKLEVLSLSHTGISEIPSTLFQNLNLLSEVFLNGNNFLSVPNSLATVGSSLKYLHLSDNPIEVIDEDSFYSLSKLNNLNISGLIDLTEIKEGSFKDATSLEVLLCHGNKKLKHFNMENLRELNHLKELDVSHNALTTLNFGEIIMTKDDVEKINSSHSENDLTEKLKPQFKKLRMLKLEGNPWHCDCSIMKSLSLFDHTAKYFIKNTNNDNARCSSPYDLSGKLLYDLPLEYVCVKFANQKSAKIPIYEPPQFLRPKSIMLTVLSVVAVIVIGLIIGFAIVCIQRKLKESEVGYSATPVRYTTVRDSNVSNIVNSPYST